MNLPQESLQKIEEFSELQFRPSQIATILEIDVDLFLEEIESETGNVFKAFVRGQLKGEAEVRKSILNMARQGSTPAQKQWMEIISENRREM